MLKSRKFRAALIGIGAVVLVQFLGMEQEAAEQVVTGILSMTGLFIVGTAAEDMAEKHANGGKKEGPK